MVPKFLIAMLQFLYHNNLKTAPCFTAIYEKLSYKIFEHFALQLDPAIEFIQLGSTPFKRQHHFGAKTSRSTFLLEKQIHPL
jgi:hypothetical protein